ncbi:MAG: hypothetical protein J6W54_07385 [Fibrobacter sp.]|uniref:hypothetical protein n=1 Tax=Fibrobacter sp. TaxID=35828 RepID=UPI001B195E88|nr:hypothetical protein [Fibrobacter sp.]MBO7060898.1 hypothetical protein [Fibrobacter sp.]
MMKRLISAVSLLSCLWACSSSDPDTAGATSETTNGIAVMVVDAATKPVPQARVTLYKRPYKRPKANPAEVQPNEVTQFLPSYVSALETAAADDSGMVQFEARPDQCQDAVCYVEGIAGEDSSLMAWTKLDAADSGISEIELLPSVSLTVRTGASSSDSTVLGTTLMLDATPYWAQNDGSAFVFSHVPSGTFAVVMWGEYVADVSLDAGASIDTLVPLPGLTREFVFEDFEDGDSLNNLAKTYPNYGWYFSAFKGASWVKPDSSGFATALKDDASHGKFLATDFALGDTGYVLMGTRLGLDTSYYDLSGLTAIRLTVRGDCEFRVALEHYLDVGDNNFRKALWLAKASNGWTDVVLLPGNELLDEFSYQVPWGEVSKEIGLFSIFITSGTHLEIDRIVFEGVDLR